MPVSRFTRRGARTVRAGAVRFLLMLLPVGMVSCLPLDTRPKPGRLLVTVSPDETLASGLVSLDGWSIGYEQFLLTIGNVRMEGVHGGGPPGPGGDDGRTCNQYTEDSTFYLRVLDMRQRGPQKVATTYALGECALGFELSPPHDEIAIGAGIDDAERAFMTTLASDPFSEGNGVSVHVAGTARKAGSTVRFRWSFRRVFAYSRCATFALQGGDTETVDLRVRGGALFQASLEDGIDGGAPEFRFDAYAAADANADGDLTLAELKAVPLPDGDPFDTLADRLYLGLAPRLLESPGGLRCFDGVLQDRPPGESTIRGPGHSSGPPQ